MKTNLFTFALVLLLGAMGYGQSGSKESKPYVARVLFTDGSKVKGILESASEEAIRLSDLHTGKEVIIEPGQVEWLKIRRKGRVGRGVLIGAGSGLLLGVGFSAAGVWDNSIIEFLPSEQEQSVKDSATTELMVGGTLLGGAVGALFGSKSEVFLLNGNPQNYLSALSVIRAYSREVRIGN